MVEGGSLAKKIDKAVFKPIRKQAKKAGVLKEAYQLGNTLKSGTKQAISKAGLAAGEMAGNPILGEMVGEYAGEQLIGHGFAFHGLVVKTWYLFEQ